MSNWREVPAEDDSDHEEAMSEECLECGVALRDHYAHNGLWRACRSSKPANRREFSEESD